MAENSPWRSVTTRPIGPAFATLLLAVSATALLIAQPVRAESLTAALASAYSSNPEINAARAGLRATDENLPQAKSLLRPTLSADGSITAQILNSNSGLSPGTNTTVEGSVGLSASQFLFRGFRTRNGIRQAEAGIQAGREDLRNTVQNILLDTATAYFDVILQAQIVELRRNNIFFLQEQLRSAQAQFELGENTITDVAETRAELGLGQSDLATAQSALSEAQARYRRLVGHDPKNLQPTFQFGKLTPKSVQIAQDVAQADHPAILAAIFQSDAAAFAVKQAEGQLLPTVSMTGAVNRTNGFDDSSHASSAAVGIQFSVPLYQGGALASQIRQAKEVLGQRKIEVDLYRDQVQAAVASSWAQIEAYRSGITAAQSQIEARGSALRGTQEEQQVGQRTRLDVLEAQRTLREAQEALATARRNLALGYFSLSSAMGQLSAEFLDLPAERYNPEQHYAAVKDKWSGLRTPDGR